MVTIKDRQFVILNNDPFSHKMELLGLGLDGILYRMVAPYALLDVSCEDDAWKYTSISSFGISEPGEIGYFNRDLSECLVVDQSIMPGDGGYGIPACGTPVLNK